MLGNLELEKTKQIAGAHLRRYISILLKEQRRPQYVRFEAFTAVTMKNAVFWYVTPCGFLKNRRLGGMYLLHHQGENIRRAKNNVSSF
jgi:hypothetical protein